MSKTSIQEKLSEKISKGEVKMKSRVSFTLKGIFYIVGFILIFGLILYLTSFIMFALRANGILLLPGFGFRGIGIFLNSFPWLLVMAAIILVFVLEFLGKKFKLIYQKPLLYSLLIILLIVIASGIVLGRTQLHSRLEVFADKGKLPIADQLYRHYGRMHWQDAYIATVITKTENKLQVESRDGHMVIVNIQSETFFPTGDDIEVDDKIMVVGQTEGGELNAFGIMKITDDQILFRKPLDGRRPRFMK